jgi:pimeloyl-ACP methyl ester carboxylesterase
MEHKGIIHFAHANGFPATAYGKLLHLLEKEYVVIAIDKLGHNPIYPVDENWESLITELSDYIRSNAGEPVIGVGHSLGAILTFMAAYRMPELFREIIMIEPPLAYGPPALLLYFAKKLRLLDRTKLVAQTRKRRTQWSSHQEAESHFMKKSSFNRFDPDCLRDYVHYGTEASNTVVKLSFDVNIEVNIFKTTPHNLSSLSDKLSVPGMLITGENTNILARYMATSFAKRYSLLLDQCKDGSHLFPLEYPQRTADLIMEAIEKLEASNKSLPH